jgi:hypothetical protein
VPASDRACTPVQPRNFHGKEGVRSSSDSGFPVSNRLSSVPGSESAVQVSTKLRAFGCDLRPPDSAECVLCPAAAMYW